MYIYNIFPSVSFAVLLAALAGPESFLSADRAHSTGVLL